MLKNQVARPSVPSGLKHAKGHYAIGQAKRLARKASASSQNNAAGVDAREASSFMPMGVSARVIRWPQL